ncbi:MAG: hypothetical protein KIS87_08830 [Phycisphaeraceae bacterium]|nr:hypothetical protein [Phycisphaeraceae bacterium]
MRPLMLPWRGASDERPFIAQPGDTAPPANLRNVVPRRGARDRVRFQTRPGVRKTFPTRLADGAPLQALAVIARASGIAGYRKGDCSDLAEWDSRQSGVIAGNAWGLRPNRGMFADHSVDPVSGSVCNAIAYDATHNRVVAASSHVAGSGGLETRLDLLDAEGNLLHSVTVTSATNTIQVSPPTSGGKVYVFCCLFNQFNPLRIYSIETGSFVLRAAYGMNGWAFSAQEGAFTTSGGTLFYNVGFQGANFGGSYQNGYGSGIIAFGKYASMFRAGVMRLRVLDAAPWVEQVTFGQQLGPSDDFYEQPGSGGVHGYWRFSERTAYRPNGVVVTGVAAAPNGTLYVATTNQGWGPNPDHADFRPDGNKPYRTLWKIEANGTLGWEVDTNSVREIGDGGFINDIPDTAGDEPSLNAVRATNDAVYVGGRRGGDGMSARRHQTTNGAPVWEANLVSAAGTIREAAIAIDPLDKAPIFGGDRNTSWDGSGGANAHLWKCNPINGSVLWSQDLNKGVSALAVACSPAGDVWYGTDRVVP